MSAWDRFADWSDRNRLAADAVPAGVVALLVVPFATVTGSSVQPTPSRTWDTIAMSLVICAAMVWRRERPVASVAVVFTTALVQILTGSTVVMPTDLVVAWSLWSVTVHGPRWASRVALAGSLVGSVLVGTGIATNRVDALALTILVALVFLSTWAVATARRSRREAMESLMDRATRLEVERDQQAQLAAASERARIAREMHDIVAHSLSVMIAQADGGRYAAATDPAAAERALGTIAETGRAALTDMRRLLGVLRAEPVDGHAPVGAGRAGAAATRRGLAPLTGTPSHTAGSPAAAAIGGVADSPTGPLPATEDIATLVERLRAGGMRASLVRVGAARTLPPGTGLTAYRIAQEALTNVLKHAGPDPQVTVVLQWLPDRVVLEVTDDGRGASADSDGLGQGLTGMRERAAMFGGHVSAGPRPGGGFQVRATLPTPIASPEPTDEEILR